MTMLDVQKIAPDSDPVVLPAEHHCRNCGAIANRHYCPECGQETRDALPTLREFMREAAGRLVAFDGRLWRTLYALALRPGFLTRAYLAGRRRHYIRPARLLLMTSLLLFAVIRFEVGSIDPSDALIIDSARTEKDKGGGKAAAGSAQATDSDTAEVELTPDFAIGIDKDINLTVRGTQDSLLATELRKRFDRFNRLSRSDKAEQILTGLVHYGSYAMFLLLPAFAWLQMVSYVGRSRRYAGRPRLYAEHLVYAAHLHTYWFLVIAIALAVPIPAVRWVLALWVIYYVARAKKIVYGGRWYGRLLRSLFVGVSYLIVIAFAMLGLVFTAVLLR
jgi:hypothetical protein